MDDVLINKADTIERCFQRIQEEFVHHENELENNYTKQDSIILNIQRMCETAIDIGIYIIHKKKLAVPQSARDVFSQLNEANIIDSELCSNLQKMVGFRNIAVHDYKKLNLDIIRSIINNDLNNIIEFKKIILKNF